MENTTKERILDAALVSFAEYGYQGANLRDLAAGLGLSKSALYKHYTGKKEIWDAVLDRMEAYYAERFGSPEKVPETPKTCGELLGLTMRMLDFTMHDEKVILTRRLLLTEQFHDERARRLASLHFLTGTAEIYTKIFARMMENGSLRQDDPEMLAFAYTSPITALIHFRDREPEKEAEITRRIEAFVRHFIGIYGLGSAKENNIRIRSERLTVRTASDEEMRTLIAEEPDEGLKAAYGEMLTMSESHLEQRQWYAAWLIELPTGERIGDLCFKGLSEDGVTEIGYGLLPEFQGKGYATEAVRAAVGWAAEQDGVRTIEAETDPENLASQRVLAKAGFVPTGTNGEEGPRFVFLPEQ